jgi:glycosyltransferase involved in cell wall biosynthesis
MSVTLSVVIPAFNVEKYILSAIQSVLDQTYKDLEVIVVNDGSTDSTAEVAASVQDKRLKIISQENTGLPGARNAGIRVAQGKYVGFVDGDDFWYPPKAAIHIEVLEKYPDIDLTFSWWKVVNEFSGDTGRFGNIPQNRIGLEELLLRNNANTSTVIARKEILEKAGFFDQTLTSLEDIDLWLRIARLKPKNFFCIQRILSAYRMRPGQMSKDWQRMLENWERVLNKIKMLEPERVSKVEYESRARFNRYLAYLAYEAHDYSSARRFLYQALTMRPDLFFDRQAWFTIAAVVCTFLPKKIHLSLAASVKNLRSKKT